MASSFRTIDFQKLISYIYDLVLVLKDQKDLKNLGGQKISYSPKYQKVLMEENKKKVGVGDCSSCVAMMLELARGVLQWVHGFKQAVIFVYLIHEAKQSIYLLIWRPWVLEGSLAYSS